MAVNDKQFLKCQTIFKMSNNSHMTTKINFYCPEDDCVYSKNGTKSFTRKMTLDHVKYF